MKARPMHLNLFVIRFPITAISSICHRISGIWIFICLPFILLMLQESLASVESFVDISNKFNIIPKQYENDEFIIQYKHFIAVFS